MQTQPYKYLDPSWQYVRAEDTDIRKTFQAAMAAVTQERIQQEMQPSVDVDELVNSWFLTNIAQ